MKSRAAEISTGLICVCVPEIAPIARQRCSSSRPTHKEVYGGFKPRDSRMRDPSASLDEVDLFSGTQEIENGYPKSDRTQVPAVMTGIRGGIEMSSREDLKTGRKAPFPENDIGVVTTIKLERSAN